MMTFLEVDNRRTVYRYIASLEDAGVKLERRKEPGQNPMSARGGHVWNRVIRLVDIRGLKLKELVS